MGYVAAPGTITGPRGVAAWGRKVAVGAGCVLLYEGSGVSWIMVRVISNAASRITGRNWWWLQIAERVFSA